MFWDLKQILKLWSSPQLAHDMQATMHVQNIESSDCQKRTCNQIDFSSNLTCEQKIAYEATTRLLQRLHHVQRVEFLEVCSLGRAHTGKSLAKLHPVDQRAGRIHWNHQNSINITTYI